MIALTTQNNSSIQWKPQYVQACKEAKDLEDSGEYEAAAACLGDLWTAVGEKPDLREFPNPAKGDVLIRIGALTGWLGSSHQIEGAQEQAKDFISEGIRLLENEGDLEKLAEAMSDLGVCYWREGAYSEAKVYQNHALEIIPGENHLQRSKIILRLVNVAISTAKYSTAAELLNEVSPIIESQDNYLLHGKLHFHKGLVNMLLFDDTGDQKNSNLAIECYLEASRFYSLAKHQRYGAVVENNLGFLLLTLKKFKKAHYHLDSAIKLLSDFDDSGRLAMTYDAKARVYLEQAKLIEAELFARKSVELLAEGDESSTLAESLTTLGTALARQQSSEMACECFDLAVEKADFVGDLEQAGLAVLAKIEELDMYLSEAEKLSLMKVAQSKLGQTERRSIKNRLLMAEENLGKQALKSKWVNFSLTEEVKTFEAEYISKAMQETGGRVTKAAELLGVSHQNLSLMLKKRHRNLIGIKKPRRQRSDSKRAQ